MKADEFLQQGIDAMKQRAALRDTPQGERSTAKAVEIFNAWTGHKLSEADGWRFLIALKQAREIQGQFHADDYVDMAAYPGLLGECLFPAEDAVDEKADAILQESAGLLPFDRYQLSTNGETTAVRPYPATPSGPACGVVTQDLGKVFDRALRASTKPIGTGQEMFDPFLAERGFKVPLF